MQTKEINKFENTKKKKKNSICYKLEKKIEQKREANKLVCFIKKKNPYL